MMNSEKTLGLYLHIPFCKEKCAYCDFYSLKDTVHMDAYVDAISAEMAARGAHSTEYLVDTVYFGGGTPSCLGGARLVHLLEQVRAHFVVAEHAEITVECNPESTDEALLRTLQAGGVNRLSFGVQSADAQELRRLGRIHSFAEAAQAVRLAQGLGFHNISVDLMYGLPDQTWNTLEQSVQQLLALSPTHISAYSLKLEPGTPMGAENPALPDEDAQADWFLAISELLRAQGYEHYEISNFAKHGFASRHNQKYWDFSPYLGLGPGAHSLFAGKRFYNRANLNAYLRAPLAVQAQERDAGVTLDEYVMLSLRTDKGISYEMLQAQFSVDVQTLERAIQPLVRQNLMEAHAGGVHLTETGFLVSNSIIIYVRDAAQPQS